MKKILLLTISALFLGFTPAQLPAQSFNYDEVQLPNPDNMSLLFFGAIAESKIYYGEAPSNNQDKPVIVFVHGFIDLANLWFTLGNDMYEEAYDDGYRTAFVALTRGEGMWTNGAILADMLEDITDHYGVDDVVIIAHSNGGKSAEVAMFAENKYDLVDRVISLGTPFRGTGLADLAETPAFNWLVDFIGLGGGTSTSTTYYMDGVARPILDNDPDNQPAKFINFGGWGYKNGTTILFPVMTTSGTLLNSMGGGPSTGGNDGVTPYYSSTRPGGYQVWDGWAWCWWCNRASKVDHIDIALSDVVWNDCSPWIQAPLAAREEAPIATTKEDDILKSNYELISTMDGSAESFKVHPGAGQVTINLMHESAANQFLLVDAQAKTQGLALQTSRGVQKWANSTVVLADLAAGTYHLETDADDFAAMVVYEQGPTLRLKKPRTFTEGSTIRLEVNMENSQAPLTVTAILQMTTDLAGETIENGRTTVLEFDKVADQYIGTVQDNLPKGVYSLTINAEGASFRRTLVSGLVIQEGAKQVVPSFEVEHRLPVYPNPVIDILSLNVELIEEGDALVEVFDAYGRLAFTQKLSSLGEGQHSIQLDLQALASGNYFVRFSSGFQQLTNTFVKLR